CKSARGSFVKYSKCFQQPSLCREAAHQARKSEKSQENSSPLDCECCSTQAVSDQPAWFHRRRQVGQPARALVSRSIMPIPASAWERVKFSVGSSRTTLVPH